MARTRASTWCAAVALLAACTGAVGGADADAVFVERFEDGPGDRWQIVSTLDPPSLRRHMEGETPGFHFESVAVEKYIRSRAHAHAAWNVGTEPFELAWDVHLERALEQNWFYPGVAVAVTSAPPGEMTEDDVAIAIGVHMGGLAASVRRGGFYDLHTEGRQAWANFRDTVLSDLIDRSSGGTASVGWPMKRPGGSRLTCRIRRTADNVVQFTILWPDLPGDRGAPYWSGQWTMPPEVAAVPLRYVSIKRMPVTKVHISYAGFIMRGVVRNVQGRRLDAAPAPVIRYAVPGRAVLAGGAPLELRGEHFTDGCRVTVGGKETPDVRVMSSQELTATLPDLPVGRRHGLVVVNPNGLAAELEGGVPYGRLLERVRPREALPAGGEVVTVEGAGFEPATEFSFGGRRAECLEVPDPGHARVRVPPGHTGPAEVSARTGEAPFKGEPRFGYAPHPYLFFTAEGLPALREKFNRPTFRHYRRRLLEQADAFLAKDVSENFNASADATMNLAFAWALTGRQPYKRKLMDWVRRGRLATRSSEFHMMSVSGMATAYDILYPDLPPEDRAAVQDYLDRMLAGYLKNARGSWFLGGPANFSNTVPVGNCGGMLAGLALMHSTPRARQAVDTAADKAKIYPDRCISPDGGCREGIQYWDYGCSFHLILAHALKHATGDDRGLLDHAHLRRNVNFLRTQLGGHGGMFAFGDTREPWLDGFAICADLGSRYDQPLMRWVADRAAEGGEKVRARGIWAPFAFLWRDTEPAPEAFPGVPTLAYLEDMHWGAMRSDGSFRPALVVGVKGSLGPLTHHKQHDLGSYVVHAHGEAYLIDPGYYEPKAGDHTLPLLDGKGPGVTGSRITEAWEAGPWRHVAVDSTEGYGEAARRVRRLLVMHGAGAVVVLDDLLPAEGKPGTVTAQYQTAWPPEIRKGNAPAIRLKGEHGELLVRCVGHPLQLAARDRTFRKKGWRWAKVGEAGPGDWHAVTGTYTADPDRPLVTVIMPLGAGNETPKVSVDYGDGAVEVALPGGARLRFARDEKGWTVVRPE